MKFLDADTIVLTGPSESYPNSRTQRVTLKRSMITHLYVDYDREDPSANGSEVTFHLHGGGCYHLNVRPHEKAVDIEAWWLGLGEVTTAGKYRHDYKPLLQEKKS